jgi:hypothetical protein
MIGVSMTNVDGIYKFGSDGVSERVRHDAQSINNRVSPIQVANCWKRFVKGFSTPTN